MLGEELCSIKEELVTVQRWGSSMLNIQGVGADVLRLDKIHPVIAGNKWFKLKHYLNDAIFMKASSITTFGGAYSNHILATAFAARSIGLPSIGVIRGERSQKPSQTLLTAASYGMVFDHVSREEYKGRNEPDFLNSISKKYPGTYLIPEGGAGEKGIKGCEEILQWIDQSRYSHILCAVGTGTMYTGLSNTCKAGIQVKGICVLKGMEELRNEYNKNDGFEFSKSCDISYDFHFGGYARKTPELLSFMNQLYKDTGIPTDFVYTGKLFYATLELVRQQHFLKGANLLIIHSGGLQGNLSLPQDTLIF
jgi:1-aminocyclopropane-1-carboxylate deaminase